VGARAQTGKVDPIVRNHARSTVVSELQTRARAGRFAARGTKERRRVQLPVNAMDFGREEKVHHRMVCLALRSALAPRSIAILVTRGYAPRVENVTPRSRNASLETGRLEAMAVSVATCKINRVGAALCLTQSWEDPCYLIRHGRRTFLKLREKNLNLANNSVPTRSMSDLLARASLFRLCDEPMD